MVRGAAGVRAAAVVHRCHPRQDRGPVHLHLLGVQHHLLAAAAGDRHRAGVEHQGGVHLPAGGHCVRCAALRQRQSGACHQHPVLQRRRRHGGQALGQQQRGHPDLSGDAGHSGGPDEQGRRLCRLWPLGLHPHPLPGRCAVCHPAAGCDDLRGRLLQLPDRGLRHAPRHRPAEGVPRKAGLPHRRHRCAGVHHCAGVQLGGCRYFQRARRLRYQRLYHVPAHHPLQLLRPAHAGDDPVPHLHRYRLRPHAAQ